METIKLAVIGAGNLRCSPAVIGSLGTYFGERPIELFLWDADEERLDLFDRLARACFLATKATHRVLASTEIDEALEESNFVLFQLGENCCRKYINASAETADDEAIRQALNDISPRVPDEATTLSIMPERFHVLLSNVEHLDWPAPIAPDKHAEHLFQVLRWVNGEDGFYPLLKEQQSSPLKKWLNKR